MNYDELRAALAPSSSVTTITGSALTPNVATLLTEVNGGNPLTITSAQPGPNDGQNDTVVLVGNCSFLNVQDAPVQLQATVDAQGNAQLTLRFTLLGPAPTPGTWKFSTSFPDLPQLPNWNQDTSSPTSPPLDDLSLSNAAFIVCTAAQSDVATSAPLVAGLNFVGKLAPSGVVAFIETLFGQADTLTLYGPIVIPASSSKVTPLQNDQQPWDLSGAVPGISLQASLGLDHHDVNNLQLNGLWFRAYAPPSTAWLAENPTYGPILAYTGQLSIPSAGVTGEVTAPIADGADSLLLLTRYTGVSVANLAAMTDAVGSSDLISTMPTQVSDGGDKLGNLQLISVNLDLSVPGATGYGLDWAQVTIGMPDLNWSVWPPHFAVDSVYSTFQVTSPFDASARQFDVAVYGRIEVEQIPVDVTATTAGGFVVNAALAEAQTIPLNKLVSDYVPGITPPGNLTIDKFGVMVAPSRYYGFALEMAGQPNPWVIPLGPSSLTISDVTMAVTVPAKGSSSGLVAGTIAFDQIGSLNISYSVPGPLRLLGSFPEVKLSGLLSELTNMPVTFPDGFDLDFIDSSVLIQAQGSNYIFQLATQVQDVGTFAFQVQKVGGQWGFAAGFDLAQSKASDVQGLSALSSFESFFGLSQFLLVVSSFNSPTFTFPELSAFNNPDLPTKKIALPGSNALVAGLNVYAVWTLDNSNEQQLIKQLLGLSPTIGVTLQVGEDPAQNSKLFVSYASTLCGMPLTCTFGGVIQSGEIGLFLTGSLQATIQGQPQTFTVVLLFVENGAFIAGSMVGPTAVDFGSFKLANLALEIGIDWEGIPSLGIAATIDTARFEASVAIFFDSAMPTKSLVAGSVSSLTLADVLATFAGDVASSEIDDVLSEIALKGTGSFTIPASVGPDLDSLNMQAVSEAFAAQNVTIPSTSTDVLLTDPDYHPSEGNNTKAPGKRWYLTDLTADSGSGMRHYELALQDGAIQVLLSPQFYCAPQATQIGAIQYPAGFFIATAIEIFGWQASIQVTIQVSSGIAIDASMDPIQIADGTVLSITGYHGQGGPVLSLATFTQPNQPKPEWIPPHFFASGYLNFLGLLQNEFFIDVTEQGFVFDITGMLLRLVTFDVHGHFDGPENFAAGGTITVGFVNETLDLGLESGPITLDTNATGTLDVAYDGKDITANFGFSFVFQGQTLEVAEFALDVEVGPLGDIWNIVRSQIIDRLLKADITLFIDNVVQQHLDEAGSGHLDTPGTHTDQAGSGHVDQTTGSHIDQTLKDWQGKPMSHTDTAPQHQDQAGTPHVDQGTPHLDQAGTPHLDSPTQHQDQYYHVDQGVETKTKPPAKPS